MYLIDWGNTIEGVQGNQENAWSLKTRIALRPGRRGM